MQSASTGPRCIRVRSKLTWPSDDADGSAAQEMRRKHRADPVRELA